MKVRCPKCKAIIEVGDDLEEARIKCRACGSVLKVRAKRKRPTRCPSCGAGLGPDAVLCVECGFDLKTGKQAHAPAEDDTAGVERERGAAPLRRSLQFVGEWLPGLFVPRVLVLSVLAVAAGFAVVWLGLLLLSLGTLIGASLVGGIGVIFYGQGCAWLISGDLSLLPQALSDFDGARWALFLGLLLTPFAIVVGLLPS